MNAIENPNEQSPVAVDAKLANRMVFAKLALAWRKDNDLTLEQAHHRLNISKSYISMVETGVVVFSDRVFLAYHKQDAKRFPLSLCGQLPLGAGEGGECV